MSLTAQQETDLLAFLASYNANKKRISDLESAVTAQSDHLLPVERAGATKNISVDDIKDFVNLNLDKATINSNGTTLLPSQITIANNATDANNDIDCSAGVFNFSDGSGQAVATAKTKRLDAAWAAGSNQGGLDIGSKANSTWYHCYAIYNPTTLASDFLFSASSSSPTLPSGYTKYKRVGSIRTDGSGNILLFDQYGNRFKLRTAIQDVDTTNPGISSVLSTLTVPLGIITIWDGYARVFDGIATTATYYALISSPSMVDSVPSSSNSNIGIPTIASPSDDFLSQGQFQIATNTSSQIRYRLSASDSAITISLITFGWIDYQL